jgi:hypothetical protein
VTDTIQFYDGLFPQLKGGTYKAHLEHTVVGGPAEPPSWSATQEFKVEAPQFAIDPSAVLSSYPPAGSTGQYDLVLPFVVLDDPSLPWERSLVPDTEQPGKSDPTPWLALVVLELGDCVVPAGKTDPVVSGPVGTLLKSTSEVHAPELQLPDVSLVVQAVTIKGSRFGAVMPSSEDIVHLAHCRRISAAGEPAGLKAVVVANRLAEAAAGETAYRAHLVSLEGLKGAITPGAKLPEKPGGGPVDVTVVSLASWSFTSTAEGAPFADLVKGLIEHQSPSPALAIPVPTAAGTPEAVKSRLEDGYVPLEYGLPSGESTLAWYRGPLTPKVPQKLPAQPGRSSDALLVYSAAEGVFDVSYAAAWQLGRSLGLADAEFTRALVRYRQAARSGAAQLAQRRSVAHLAAQPAADLLAPNPSRHRLVAAIAEGLGQRWTTALRGEGERWTTAPRGEGYGAETAPPPAEPLPDRGRAAVAAVLGDGEGVAALQDQLADLQAPVAAWLAGLALLERLPFANLVPAPAMLPAESVRFFHVDPSFTQALVAGAMSIGVQSSADVAIDEKLRPSLEAALAADLAKAGASGEPLSGVLIRSALVPAWPTLVVSPTLGKQSLPTVRRDTLGEDVLLCLWSGVPNAVSLSEPYQGLRFGIEPEGIALRNVTTPGSIGKQLGTSVAVPSAEGRVDVTALATTIAKELGLPALGAGNLAIQLVLAPERQTFPTGKTP